MISLSTHPIFPNDFSHAVYLFQRLKTCFAHIHIGCWDYIICCVPFVFKSFCLFLVTSSNFFSIFFALLISPMRRRNIVEMTLFQKHEVSYSETKRCLRVCVEKIACRYNMQVSVVRYKLLPSQYLWFLK